MADFGWLLSPPFSALAVFGVSFLMSLSTTLLNRKFVNQTRYAEWQEETRRYNADKQIAKKTGDKKLISKLKKQEKRINQMQSKMLKGQMLNLFTTWGLLILVWQLLIISYGGASVAYVPFGIPFLATQPPYTLPVVFWYVFCSFFSSSIVSRIFGVRMGMGMQPPTAA